MTELNPLAPVPQSFTPHSQLDFETASVYRILDASANRCREGLRVVEEYARFYRNDAQVTALLKSLRHRLVATLNGFRLEKHLYCRDTPGDVGTRISLPSEQSRQSLRDVLQANLKRIAESLRVLEEYGKIIDSTAASEIESIRYELYEVEKHLLDHSREALLTLLQQATIYLLVSEASCSHHSLEQTVRQSIAGGVGIVQLREKHDSDRILLQKARLLRQVTREMGALLIMNDRPDLAVLCDADGVHVGQDELTVAEVRRIVGKEMLVGLSTHSLQQAQTGEAEGADYLGVGPVFPSGTKQFQNFVGTELLSQISAKISIPWYAIGGITSENARQAREAGAGRIAVSQVLCQAAEPEGVARDLQKIFSSSGTNVGNFTS